MEYKLINTEYLDSVSGGDNGIVIEIVSMFKEQADEIYNEMKVLLAGKKYEILGMLAHKAKSSVAIMGMNDLAQMLKSFELLAKEVKETEKYESFIERFRNETTEAVKELDDFISKKL
jgi:HPt (histidine-containing phosphotransfer) domain-containing protein